MAYSIHNQLRKKLANFTLGNLFQVVTEEDILRINENGEVFFEGRALSTDEKNVLKAEAERLMHSFLWKVIGKEMMYDACRRMYFESRNDDDLLAGKTQLYVWRVVGEVIEKCRRFF